MGYRNQSGSRRGIGEKFQRSCHEKAKQKPRKKSNLKYVEETTPSAQEISERTLGSLSKLGSQTFALSPFSQYYDDWLVNLRQVISEFESVPGVNVDEIFLKCRAQIFADVEGELANRRIKETELEGSARELSENNHLLVETDALYSTQTRELATKRNNEIDRLTKNLGSLEKELDNIGQMKTSFFGFTKKAKAKKQAEATQKITAAKSELEIAMQNFTVEQEKLHDQYEKKKQSIIDTVRSLEREIENIEVDSSTEPRLVATAALADAVKALVQRKASSNL